MNSLVQQIQRVPTASLKTHPDNARRGNVEAIATSLRVNHQFSPIVVQASTNYVLSGNHTLMAARELEWPEIDVVFVDVDDHHAHRIMLAANRTADLGTYDDDALAALLQSLDGDLEGTGYTDEDLAAILGDEQEQNPDDTDVDALPQNVPAIARPGDLWLLGPHRLACGDSTDAHFLDYALGGATPGIVYTDPPYGISIVKSNGKIGSGGPVGGVKKGKIDSGKIVETREYLPVAGDDTTDAASAAFQMAIGVWPNARHVWWGGNHYAQSAGLLDSSCWLIWDKENGTNDFADAELAWTNYPGAVRIFRHMWNGMLRASEREARVHPTQKPVALAQWAFGIVDPKAKETVVLDLFGGSGSTLIAAHETNRHAVLVEMEPHYIDVILKRYQGLTGDLPILESTGEAHDFSS